MIPTEFMRPDDKFLIQDVRQQQTSCLELVYAREALQDNHAPKNY